VATKRLSHYLKTYRKHSGLTQEEVAFLMGCRDGGKISRHERLSREPSLKTALSFEAVFCAPASELFSGTFEKVAEEVIERARRLHENLSRRPPTPRTLRKLQALERIIAE
jgi:transcriptional regulator with XRE-family HTH domain